jgi:hypothetical protein
VSQFAAETFHFGVGKRNADLATVGKTAPHGTTGQHPGTDKNDGKADNPFLASQMVQHSITPSLALIMLF